MARERALVKRLMALAAGLVLAAGPRAPAAATAGATPAAAASHAPVSVKDSPGYYPPADPESASVRIGRRLNAPVVSTRFTGGCKSLDELGRAVLWSLHHSDKDSLLRLCVDHREFSQIMWREFPESRPATGLSADDAWAVLDRRFLAGVDGALHEYRGRPLVFVRVERYDSLRTYKNFRIHNGFVIVSSNERGEEERLRFVRAAVERKGRFKIESTTD